MAVTVACDGRPRRPDGGNRSAELPAELATLARSAPFVVVGRVVRITQGRVAGPVEEPLQFEDVRLVIERVIKGAPPGDTIVVEQVSSQGRVILDFDPYRTGERYVLFLRTGDAAGYNVVLSPGRFVLSRGVVRASYRSPISATIDGVKEESFLSQLERAAQR